VPTSSVLELSPIRGWLWQTSKFFKGNSRKRPRNTPGLEHIIVQRSKEGWDPVFTYQWDRNLIYLWAADRPREANEKGYPSWHFLSRSCLQKWDMGAACDVFWTLAKEAGELLIDLPELKGLWVEGKDEYWLLALHQIYPQPHIKTVIPHLFLSATKPEEDVIPTDTSIKDIPRSQSRPAKEGESYTEDLDNVFLKSAMLCAKLSTSNNQRHEEDEESERNESYIKKGPKKWEFAFAGKTVSVDAKLKGLVLIEQLLLHENKEYTPLELLKEVDQREKGETEPELIYTRADIDRIKKAIKGLRDRAALSTNLEEKERLEQEADKADKRLYKARNYKGNSRKTSDSPRISVITKIDVVLKKIAPEHLKLYNHLDTFLKRGVICSYKPDSKVIWDISKKTS